MCCFENALKDAEASLKEDKTFSKGVYQKAEAFYYMGEFEFALMFYHRGLKLRPLKQFQPEFQEGIEKATVAILNSVANPSLKLEKKGDLTFLQRQDEMADPFTIAIQHLAVKKKRQAQRILKSEKTAKQWLGEFYDDRKFLEEMLSDEGWCKGKTKHGERLQDIIQSSITSIDACAEFLNQRNPTCTLERENKQKCSKPHRSPPSDPAQFLMKSLDEIDADLTSGNAEGSLKKAKEVLKNVQGWSEKDVPNKKEVLGSLHSCIGNALIHLGEMDKALEHHQKDLELAKQCKLPDAMSRALENIGRVYAEIGQYTQAIEFLEKKIPLVCGGLEETWLFHEIGRCYLELHRFKEARDYGLRSLAAANEIAHGKWQIRANVLVAQSEFPLGNFETCVSHFERALAMAKLQEDQDALNAIQKVLDEAKHRLSQ
uniref:outer dynein arm-docking complex subunit 4-like n=1 Tax=Semicossyphus pulcher TaxID=241346 RepID=UPI0037E76C0A